MSQSENLHAKLRAVREKRVKPADLYQVIHDFGNAGFTQAEPIVAHFLADRNHRLRYIAINVLTLHWDMARYRDEVEILLVDDPALAVRRMAAVGLGHVLRGTHDKSATQLLLARLRDAKEDGSVREAAYGALLDIWLPEAVRKEKKLSLLAERAEASVDIIEETEHANLLPEPLRILEIDSIHEKADEEWKHRVDWKIVESIERGEIPR